MRHYFDITLFIIITGRQETYQWGLKGFRTSKQKDDTYFLQGSISAFSTHERKIGVFSLQEQ